MTVKSNLILCATFGISAALFIGGTALTIKSTSDSITLPDDVTRSARICKQQIKAGQGCSLEGQSNLLLLKELDERRLNGMNISSPAMFFMLLTGLPYLMRKQQSAKPDKTPTPQP